MQKIITLLKTLFSRRWWWVTILVIVGMVVLARLGIWQLNRLAERRAANAILQAQLDAPPIQLNELLADNPDLVSLADREVTVRGTYDFAEQVLVKLQSYNGQPGIHLLAPLEIEGTEQAVLVNRGWLPVAENDPAGWGQYDEPGMVAITGVIQLGDKPPEGAEEPAGRQLDWFRVDIQGINTQTPYDLLPVYILETPAGETNTGQLIKLEPEIDLSEGPHMSYAIQWFSFTLMLGGGYIYYVYRDTFKQPAEMKNDRDQ